MSLRPFRRVSMLAFLLSCERGTGSPAALEELPEDIVATVGEEAISARQVVAVASARELPPAAARDALVRDALFAELARADANDEAVNTSSRVLARAMLHRLSKDSAEKPIDATELRNWSMARFIDVDRPHGFRVVHAVVLVPSTASPEVLSAAKAHAALIRSTAEPMVREAAGTPPPARSGRDVFLERPEIEEDRISLRFRTAVETLGHGDLNVRFESLGVISEDGRSLHYGKSPWDRMNESFAHAAAQLRTRGDLSPIVETSLEADGKTLRGYHIIALLEQTPPHRLEPAERVAFLRPEILESRARDAQAQLLDNARQRARIQVERNAPALLESLALPTSPKPAAQDAR